jgi:hypothetical protein
MDMELDDKDKAPPQLSEQLFEQIQDPCVTQMAIQCQFWE